MSTMTSSFRFRMVGPSRSRSRVWLLTPACSDPLNAKLWAAEDALSYRNDRAVNVLRLVQQRHMQRWACWSHSQVGCDRKDRQC
ncbi:MAG: hypothetical protein QOH82_2492 [Mycobacterium sp.]|jgi:hypothetical protein|nr:hypothetical protein [Mycobacterium sp.]